MAITITGTLKTILGAADPGATLRVTLCNFGPNPPRVSGSGILVDVDVPVAVAGDGTFSFSPIGNDVIIPGPNITYYTVAFQPSTGGILKVIAYQFTGSGSFDLSTLAPFGGPGTPPVVPTNAVITNPSGLQSIATFALRTRLALPGNNVAFSANPVFDATQGTRFDLTLTGNVASSTLINTVDGEIVVFDLKQDATGGRTFTWPANVSGAFGIDPTANKRSIQAFIQIGATFFPFGPMMVI